jgi:hypothetical protein
MANWCAKRTVVEALVQKPKLADNDLLRSKLCMGARPDKSERIGQTD